VLMEVVMCLYLSRFNIPKDFWMIHFKMTKMISYHMISDWNLHRYYSSQPSCYISCTFHLPT
jgi:hypothetical protein